MSPAGAWLLLAGLACGEIPAPVSAPGQAPLVLRQVRLRRGDDLVINAAQATVDSSGDGQAVQVRATLRPQVDEEGGADRSPPPPLQVEAPRSSWDLRTRTVHFTGGVRAVRGPVELRCDELDVRYLDADRVDEAVCTGSVQLSRDARRATGQRAVLSAQDGRVVLTGEATVTEGPNTMRGERITLFLDDERLECDHCTLVVAGPAVAPRSADAP